MFVRTKKRGKRIYLQVVENVREDGKPRQRVMCTLGRLDILEQKGNLENIIESAARFCKTIGVIRESRKASPQAEARIVGPSLICNRLWKDLGIDEVLEGRLLGRQYEFSVERAVFMTVLHRLCCSGSDRAAEKWKQWHRIEGAEALQLHQLYRTMAWLGEELPEKEQEGTKGFSPRCIKDQIEEDLFARRRDLYSGLDMVFFDTTSIYFEGAGGQTLGARGNSKDHRPDLKQMVVGVVLDREGNPVCSELWPGNTADVKTLKPVSERLRKRFGIEAVCIVADRGMISAETVQELEARNMGYILGARMRRQTEVREEVLGRAGRFQEIHPERKTSKDPSPLSVKEVRVQDRRYVVCYNAEQARKDAGDRAAILDSLRLKLVQGDTALVGNKGYRKFLASVKGHFEIDKKKTEREERFDGLWVLRTNQEDISAADIALRYKQLWMVEDIFRTMKSILETRPIWHKCDETIRGHVFCSFLALMIRKELQDRLDARGYADIEWDDVISDLNRLEEVESTFSEKRFMIRTECCGVAGKVFQSVGVTLPGAICMRG